MERPSWNEYFNPFQI